MGRALALLAGTLAFGAVAEAQAPKVEAELQKTYAQFGEAFNRFDAQAVSSFWAKDGTLINPMGKPAKGPAEVARVFGEDAQTFLGGTTSTFTVRSVRQLKGDVAFVDLDHAIENFRAPDGTTRTEQQHVVMLVRKQGGAWKFLDVRPYAFVKPAPETGAAGR
jgi:uncharacterized protein (TIGR02246 family)